MQIRCSSKLVEGVLDDTFFNLQNLQLSKFVCEQLFVILSILFT